MKISNVGGFVCHMANVIILLYSILVFFSQMSTTEKIITICFLMVNVMGLTATTYHAVTVNHEVRINTFSRRFFFGVSVRKLDYFIKLNKRLPDNALLSSRLAQILRVHLMTRSSLGLDLHKACVKSRRGR
jgi:hypothetical protein